MSTRPVDAPPEIHDFDFIHGRWTVAHRRLKRWGAGADDWDEFRATATCEPRLGGMVNVEEMVCPERGWMGMAVRSFDLDAGEWSIWWISDRDGRLGAPVRGRFNADGCVLQGPDAHGGRPIIARYIWSDIRPDSARWTQKFSYDAGATWETNWIMDFARAAA